MNLFNVTVYLKMVEMVNFLLQIFYHSFKKSVVKFLAGRRLEIRTVNMFIA